MLVVPFFVDIGIFLYSDKLPVLSWGVPKVSPLWNNFECSWWNPLRNNLFVLDIELVGEFEEAPGAFLLPSMSFVS